MSTQGAAPAAGEVTVLRHSVYPDVLEALRELEAEIEEARVWLPDTRETIMTLSEARDGIRDAYFAGRTHRRDAKAAQAMLDIDALKLDAGLRGWHANEARLGRVLRLLRDAPAFPPTEVRQATSPRWEAFSDLEVRVLADTVDRLVVRPPADWRPTYLALRDELRVEVERRDQARPA